MLNLVVHSVTTGFQKFAVSYINVNEVLDWTYQPVMTFAPTRRDMQEENTA